MNIEEAIKILDKFITEHKLFNIKHSDGLEQAIETLLTAYEEKCKELKKEIQDDLDVRNRWGLTLQELEKEKEANRKLDKEAQGYLEELAGDDSMNIRRIQELEAELEKEKEKNKRAEELYMQHNQMIIDILKECDYIIKNRCYMNDVAIRQHAEKIKDISKYYIKEPKWKEE